MISIVPLAGPDLVHPVHGLRPLFPVEGEPLLRRALTSRSWWISGLQRPENMVFVLPRRDEAETVSEACRAWFPGCRFVWLSDLTAGALLSAVAGTALAPLAGGPLCIDLADLLYELDTDTGECFSDPAVGAAVPCFTASDPCYSYLEMTADRRVLRAREKQVISSTASAGTYIFRDGAVWFEAVAHSLRHADELSLRGVMFVCPAINGVIANGRTVMTLSATNVQPVGKLFHKI